MGACASMMKSKRMQAEMNEANAPLHASSMTKTEEAAGDTPRGVVEEHDATEGGGGKAGKEEEEVDAVSGERKRELGKGLWHQDEEKRRSLVFLFQETDKSESAESQKSPVDDEPVKIETVAPVLVQASELDEQLIVEKTGEEAEVGIVASETMVNSTQDEPPVTEKPSEEAVRSHAVEVHTTETVIQEKELIADGPLSEAQNKAAEVETTEELIQEEKIVSEKPSEDVDVVSKEVEINENSTVEEQPISDKPPTETEVKVVELDDVHEEFQAENPAVVEETPKETESLKEELETEMVGPEVMESLPKEDVPVTVVAVASPTVADEEKQDVKYVKIDGNS